MRRENLKYGDRHKDVKSCAGTAFATLRPLVGESCARLVARYQTHLYDYNRRAEPELSPVIGARVCLSI